MLGYQQKAEHSARDNCNHQAIEEAMASTRPDQSCLRHARASRDRSVTLNGVSPLG
jgi:hypothetical protein